MYVYVEKSILKKINDLKYKVKSLKIPHQSFYHLKGYSTFFGNRLILPLPQR